MIMEQTGLYGRPNLETLLQQSEPSVFSINNNVEAVGVEGHSPHRDSSPYMMSPLNLYTSPYIKSPWIASTPPDFNLAKTGSLRRLYEKKVMFIR